MRLLESFLSHVAFLDPPEILASSELLLRPFPPPGVRRGEFCSRIDGIFLSSFEGLGTRPTLKCSSLYSDGPRANEVQISK